MAFQYKEVVNKIVGLSNKDIYDIVVFYLDDQICCDQINVEYVNDKIFVWYAPHIDIEKYMAKINERYSYRYEEFKKNISDVIGNGQVFDYIFDLFIEDNHAVNPKLARSQIEYEYQIYIIKHGVHQQFHTMYNKMCNLLESGNISRLWHIVQLAIDEDYRNIIRLQRYRQPLIKDQPL